MNWSENSQAQIINNFRCTQCQTNIHHIKNVSKWTLYVLMISTFCFKIFLKRGIRPIKHYKTARQEWRETLK
jgi:hypothetical protein